MHIVLIASALIGVSTGPAYAQDSAQARASQGETIVSDDTAEGALAAESVEITDQNHPDYVRCRSEPIMGSLARRRRVCMTNTQWTEAARVGGENSREITRINQPGFYIPGY